MLQFLGSESSISAPRTAGLFEPECIVAVVGMAHLIRLAVADPDAFNGLRRCIRHFSASKVPTMGRAYFESLSSLDSSDMKAMVKMKFFRLNEYCSTRSFSPMV